MHNGEFRYFHELVEKFHNPARVGAYCVAFVFLALHLLHGFESAFQSVGANNKYTKGIEKLFKNIRYRDSCRLYFYCIVSSFKSDFIDGIRFKNTSRATCR
jgi:hypothetical protein